MASIYHKTAQGSAEISTRAHGLSARLRRCLILVDGKRTLDELKTVLSSDDVDAMLVELLDQGYIEGYMPAPAMLTTALEIHAMDAPPTTLLGASPAQRRTLSFAERRLRGVRIVQDLLGPMAENTAVKIEQTKDDAALNMQLEKAYGYIRELCGKAAADKFRGDVRLPAL